MLKITKNSYEVPFYPRNMYIKVVEVTLNFSTNFLNHWVEGF